MKSAEKFHGKIAIPFCSPNPLMESTIDMPGMEDSCECDVNRRKKIGERE